MNVPARLLASSVLMLTIAGCGGGASSPTTVATPAASPTEATTTPAAATTPAGSATTPAGTPATTPTEAATGAESPTGSPGAGALPPEVDAAFCRFETEFSGAFAERNRDLGAALQARDVPTARQHLTEVSDSIERLRPDLETIAEWAPATPFATELMGALDAYVDSLEGFFENPTNAAPVQSAGQGLTAAAQEYPALRQQYPDVACP